MSSIGEPIEAVLKLNTSGFTTGIDKSIEALEKFQKSSTGVRQLNDALKQLQQQLGYLDGVSKSNLNTFSRLSTAINKMANGLKVLQSDSLNVDQAINTMNSIFKAFQSTLNGTEVKVRAMITDFTQLESVEKQEASVMEQVAVATQQYDRALELALPPTRNLITGTNELMLAQNGLQKEERETASATDKATQSMNRQASASKGLSKAMSSLRMVGTMVASMMVWNFASSLINATRETVNAKSEMEGYFQMLHFSGSEINQFNKKLDETVHRFQRINKYALGETISSIGVEFNLTTQEMEKAMPVVSMITSEYLRAGRNVNEASLAVKDILQGEFQRLSRETGVKGEQLKEAGWSGDKSDVMGLLEALDKVGKSRNWDVFVTKANSLNDAVLILQNRFSEWSADMVNAVQPTILAVFNNLMGFADGLSQSLGGLWKWLNGSSWGATATKIGLVSSAIMVLMPLLTAWRSGSKLIELASLSLKQQLTALVFGINAETIATTGSSSAIGMKILSLEAEEVAEFGVMNAIRGKLLGMEAEKVATLSSTEMNFGFVGSLYAMVTGEALAEAETLSLSGALAILTGTFLASPIGWFTLAILGLASAFYVLTGGLSDTWEKTKQFNDTMRDTSSAYKEAGDWLAQYTKEHEGEADAIDKANDKYDKYIQNLQSASYWYNHFQTEFNGLDLTADTTSDKVLENYGISQKQADEWNANLDNLHFGKWKYYKAEQVLNKQLNGENSNFSKDLDEYLGKVQKNGGDLEDAYTRMKGNYENLAYHSAIANTTDSWWEWLWNSFYAGMDQFWIDWDKFWADPQWSTAIDGIAKIFGSGEDQLGVGGFGSILGLLGIHTDNIGEEITNFFNNIGAFFEGKSLMELIGLDESHDYNADILNFVNNSIITPLGNALYEGLHYLPIVGSFISLWEDVTDENIGASDVGEKIAGWIGTGLTIAIGNIPVVGSILKLLGLIPSTYAESNSKGKGVGDNVDKGYFDGTKSLVSNAIAEFGDIAKGIQGKFSEAYSTAKGYGEQLWSGLNSVLDRQSPGFFYDQVLAEFGTDIPSAISESGSTAYSVAQGYAQNMYAGMNSVNNEFGLGSVVNDYQDDAQILAQSSQMMGVETTTAFNNMQTSVDGITNQMQGNVINSYTAMQTKQSSMLNQMKSSNTTAYNDMYTKSNQSLIQMRDSTSNVTKQMTDAWSQMKNSIVASAKKISDDSSAHFSQLSTTIGNFYRKIQNPAQWGSGSVNVHSRSPTGTSRRIGRAVFGHGAGGGSTYTGARTMSIQSLKRKLCPNGDCGTLFDGYENGDIVDVLSFLAGVTGEHGFGGWDFSNKHYNYIKTRTGEWDMKSPVINLAGGISTNTPFKVNEFFNGTPKISFSKFQSIAGSIFSAIPYKHYYDSSWKGSWLGALQAGACNCSDGADALIALARTFGFEGYKQWGTWDGEGHFWAVINGTPMDTTAWQGGYGWTSPKVSGYGARNLHSSDDSSKTLIVNIDMTDAVIYGVDDLDNRMEEATRKALRSEFNTSYTIGV